jgi:hypothetical protein
MKSSASGHRCADVLSSATRPQSGKSCGVLRLVCSVFPARFLPISAVIMLAASQLASAQSIQPTSPCPPGKIAQNKSPGTDTGQRTAQINEERRKGADNPRLADNYDSGGRNKQMKPVAGQPIDPMGCR